MNDGIVTRTRAFVGVGSNLGNRAGYLLLGVRGMLEAGLPVARLSSIYETEPVDVPDAQPPYLNMVVELRGDGGDNALPAPEQMLARLLRVEYLLGRRRETPHAARTLDLDLLIYGDLRQQTELLTLPHPRLHLRRFVLAPLAELAPDGQHPTLRQTFTQLLAATADDELTVRLWQP